jgi:hypothetical protein
VEHSHAVVRAEWMRRIAIGLMVIALGLALLFVFAVSFGN